MTAIFRLAAGSASVTCVAGGGNPAEALFFFFLVGFSVAAFDAGLGSLAAALPVSGKTWREGESGLVSNRGLKEWALKKRQ